MPQGYWLPVLHAHLPYVRHPEHPQFLEEDWLFEALTETYVPLVRVLDGLDRDAIDWRLTMTLSPTLVSMLADELLVSRYRRHLDRLVLLCEREVERTARDEPRFAGAARFYLDEFSDVRRVFRDLYASDLLAAFRRHADSGRLEILTCGATHGFLPLMDPVPEAVRAQIEIGVHTHRRLLGRAPRGIWLPECGYMPGHDAFLLEAGLRYTFVESHGIEHAHPQPSHGVRAPIASPAGLVFFGRDLESSRQVWSAEVGYPGDPEYREFYKDVGWDLPLDYLAEFLGDGLRRNLGVKYYRVTGAVGLGDKQPYARAAALARVAAHAEHFVQARQEQVRAAAAHMPRPPLVVSPYDAELFGHWWYEGPQFLDAVFRRLHAQDVVRPVTAPEYLERHPEVEQAQPPMCTWGAQGYADVWLNPGNDWIYPHLDNAAEAMVELARRFEAPDGLQRRALNQAARELLLAQSSDWAFIMKTGTTVEYANKRVRDHIARFAWLRRALLEGGLDDEVLREFEQRDNIFPDLDYRIYAPRAV